MSRLWASVKQKAGTDKAPYPKDNPDLRNKKGGGMSHSKGKAMKAKKTTSY